jgi:alkaline phosphatase D
MPRAATGDIYGSVPLGAAELFLLDTRQYRDDQPCNPSDSFVSNPCPPTDYDKPGRTLLGAQQKAWLKGALSGSQAQWKLIANQVMITSLDAPPHNPINTDSWDGYGAERAELIDFIGANGIDDVSFITGDIHTYFTGEVTRTGRHGPTDGPVRATEFVCSAITSPGIVDRVADTEPERVAAATASDAAVLGNNPQIVYSNQAYKGYGIVEARGDELHVTYRAAHETRREPAESFTLRSFRVEAGRAAVIDDGGPLPLPEPAAPGPLSAAETPQGLALGAGQ